MHSLNIVFAGTPIFGLPALKALVQSEHQLKGVFTQPDKPKGRGLKLTYSPIKIFAEEAKIPVFQPQHFKTEANIELLKALEPDIMVVIAYGLILPESVLNIPRLGCINVHASLLPRWRGASPIQQAILANDKISGVTIMQMDKGMDTGAILTQAEIPLRSDETAQTLHDKLADLSIDPLLKTLAQLQAQSIQPQLQEAGAATYATKIAKEDAYIDWSLPAETIERRIRAYNPWPIAYTTLHDQPVRIFEASILHQHTASVAGAMIAVDPSGLKVATGQGILVIHRLQFPGGKVLAVQDWAHNQQAKLLLNQVLI